MIVRNNSIDHVSISRVKRDIQELIRLCQPAIRRTHKVIAHTERDRRKVGNLTFEQVDGAIDALEETFSRYSLLLNGKVCTPLAPFEAYNVLPDFQAIWPP